MRNATRMTKSFPVTDAFLSRCHDNRLRPSMSRLANCWEIESPRKRLSLFWVKYQYRKCARVIDSKLDRSDSSQIA